MGNKVLRNLSNMFSFNNQDNEDDDYFLDSDYDDYGDDGDYDDYGDDDVQDDAPRPSFFSRKNSQDKAQPQKSGFLNRNKVVPISNARDMEVTMVKPTSMDDSRNICDYLLEGKAVVLNMEGMNTDTAQRIIDFTLGAIYSLDGDLQMISQYIFIASPKNVELSGDFEGSFQNMVAEKTVRPYAFGGMRFNG